MAKPVAGVPILRPTVFCSYSFTSITKNVYRPSLARQFFRFIGIVSPNCLHSPSRFQIEYSSNLRSEPLFSFQLLQSLDNFSGSSEVCPRIAFIPKLNSSRPLAYHIILEVNLGIVSRSELSSPLDCSNIHFFTCFSASTRKREVNIVPPNAHGIGSDFT